MYSNNEINLNEMKAWQILNALKLWQESITFNKIQLLITLPHLTSVMQKGSPATTINKTEIIATSHRCESYYLYK